MKQLLNEVKRMQKLAGVNNNSIKQLEKTLEDKLKAYSGEDVFCTTDEDSISVEIIKGPNKSNVIKAIKDALREVPTYKVDPNSKYKSPDGDVSFEIVKKYKEIK